MIGADFNFSWKFKTLEWTFKEEFKLDWEKRDSRSWKETIESDKKN